MFEFFRTHQKLMQIVLALIIVPSFALVGVSGYKSFGDDANTIAKVAGHPLTQSDWEQAQRNALDKMRQRMGQQFDQSLFDTPEFKQTVLDNLIAERSISAEALKAHLTVADATLQKQILQIPGMTKDNGSFDMERYRAVLAQQNMTPTMHQNSLRNSMTFEQLAGAIEGSGFAPRTVAKQISDFGSQEREVQELVLPISSFVEKVKVTDEMVKAFYDKNAKMFEIPEQAKIEYVVLNAEAAAAMVTVTDEEVAAYYRDNTKRFTTPEIRRASHILVAMKTGAEKAAAKAKAEALLAEVRKAPADFAKIAKAKSEDPASAELGGDLDVVTKDSLPKPVEAAVMSLKHGEISNVVESDFGFHILTVDIKPQTVKPLDEVKGEIMTDLKNQKAAKKYSELAGVFTDTVYEQADSLKPVAEKLKLKIETMEGLGRTPSPMLGAAPFNNDKFLKAVFSDDAIKNKRNTQAIEVTRGTLVAGRIVEFKPASKRPLAEVDGPIRQRVTMEEALKLAKAAGEEKLAAAKKSDDAAAFGAAKLVSRAKPEGLNPVGFGAVMKAEVAKLPAYVGVEVPGMGYAVYRIGKVQQPSVADAARVTAEAEQIASIMAQQDMAAYIEVLKKKAEVKIIRPINSAAAKPVE